MSRDRRDGHHGRRAYILVRILKEDSRVLAGGGEMGALMRATAWERTPLGAVDSWSASLRTVVSLVLSSEHAMFVWWGPELVQFYNDAYRPILGSTKHPAAMGQRGRECWTEIWPIIEPMIEKVLAGGATYIKAGLLLLERNGFAEECYFDYAYSPIRDDSSSIAGIFVACSEVSASVIGERRLRALGQLGVVTLDEKTPDLVCRAAGATFDEIRGDLPFALVYLLDESGREARLASTSGLVLDHPAAPSVVSMDDTRGTWPLGAALASESVVDLRLLPFVTSLPGGPGGEAPHRVVILPLKRGSDERPHGFLVAAVSPRLLLDEAYLGFFRLVAGHLASAIQNARSYEHEKKRAESLAELDKSKTAFFGNVSHEFRTPLTLILGPTEDALASPARRLEGEQLERVHGNAQRLLRLVNTLLEFSRIEAGKAQVSFQATDLAVVTAGLAYAFESVVEQAGLRLLVDCPPLPELVWVDIGLWEKIVLNLVSNAFKFTLVGHIAVRLGWTSDGVELAVEDTGIGIASDEVAKVFQRFHRIQGAQGRSHEGSGIGLSLVQELAHLHGGRVSVVSTPGVGSTFTVRLPAGRSHVSTDGAHPDVPRPVSSTAARAFVREAQHWLPAQGETDAERTPAPESSVRPAAAPVAGRRLRALVADDNADMRAYVQTVLEGHFVVQSVADGIAALEAALEAPPDIVLSDVMMPGLDGLALTRALRQDARTTHVPIVLLSARAGEGATVEGLEAGADDYLVKPFSARELVARMQGAVKVARSNEARRQAVERLAEALESMGDGFFALDAEWRFTAVNSRYEELSATCRQDALGHVFWDAHPAARDPTTQYWQQYHRCMDERVSVHFVDHYGPLDLWTDVRAHPTPDGGMAVFFRDVSAEHKAKEALLRQSEFEQQLIGIVSHDLRNPLNTIQIGSQILQATALDETSQRVLQRIRSAVDRGARLVNDLLDFTQARLGGGIPVLRSHGSLHAVLRQVVDDWSITAPGRDVRVALVGDGEGEWDLERMFQVLQNLLGNAVKYSAADSVIDVRSESDAEGVTVSVHNTGSPIPAESLSRIFQPMQRATSQRENTARSVGLGLFIVKHLIDAHGGRLSVTSTAEAGTTFTFWVPTSPGR